LTQNAKTIFSGQIVELTLETVELANGSKLEYEIVRHPGGAAIVVLNSANEICLLRQYRYVLDDWIWELPAGKIDNNEPPQETASRELLEEAGVIARDWASLGSVISSPGVFSEVVHMFLARDIEMRTPEHEEGEVIEIHWFTLPEAKKMVLDNKINDSKTVIGIFRAVELLGSTR